MITFAWSPRVAQVFREARRPRRQKVAIGEEAVEILAPFPSPEDWRDVWMYQILLDRFNNPSAPPQLSWDGEHNSFQGGTLNGVTAQLDYLKQLGAGALWISPVLKNPQFDSGSYHGYGIQDFFAIDPRHTSDPERAKNDADFAEGELRNLVDQAHARGIYVIMDIVLNHAGDIFEYEGFGGVAPWRDDPPYDIRWRDENGQGRADWSEAPANAAPDAAVWPAELRKNEYLRRRGNAFTRPQDLQTQAGDFFTLKEWVTDFREPGTGYFPVRDILIRVYEYMVARFDVDGFRIDTLKYIEPRFAQLFGDAMREFALSIGKRNFFTFGEVYDQEDKIAAYIGRNACTDNSEMVGVDAALDFPLFYRLPQVAKGMLTPNELVQMYVFRKQAERGILSSHGEASKFFVTFLDNHDQYERFYFADPDNPTRFQDQATLGIACLYSLLGIPCLYYGTEQGLHGHGSTLEAVREALWGKPGGFDQTHPLYRAVKQISAVRAAQPPLRYGRQYFRPISGDGTHFGISTTAPGIIAFSRILQDLEVVVVANTNSESGWNGEVIVDAPLNPVGTSLSVCYSNKADGQAVPPGPVMDKSWGSVEVYEADGGVTDGPLRAIAVTLRPMEIQILSAG